MQIYLKKSPMLTFFGFNGNIFFLITKNVKFTKLCTSYVYMKWNTLLTVYIKNFSVQIFKKYNQQLKT